MAALGLLPCAPAAAALSCEQVFAITQAAVRYRDQGYSLEQVLSALKGVDPDNKLTGVELEALRNAVSLAYLGHAGPEEIALECMQARGQAKP